MRARPNLHELLNFRCTRCSDRDARLGYFLLHINTNCATAREMACWVWAIARMAVA